MKIYQNGSYCVWRRRVMQVPLQSGEYKWRLSRLLAIVMLAAENTLTHTGFSWPCDHLTMWPILTSWCSYFMVGNWDVCSRKHPHTQGSFMTLWPFDHVANFINSVQQRTPSHTGLSCDHVTNLINMVFMARFALTLTRLAAENILTHRALLTLWPYDHVTNVAILSRLVLLILIIVFVSCVSWQSQTEKDERNTTTFILSHTKTHLTFLF